MGFNSNQPRYDLTADVPQVRSASWAALNLGEALLAESRELPGIARAHSEAANHHASRCYEAQTVHGTQLVGSYSSVAECVELVLS